MVKEAFPFKGGKMVKDVKILKYEHSPLRRGDRGDVVADTEGIRDIYMCRGIS